MANTRRRAKPKINVEPISVWQALNQPVAEISEETAKHIFTLLAVFFLAVWVAPYWGNTPSFSSSPLVGEERWGGRVAGEQIVAELASAPAWYYVVQDIPGDVAEAFAVSANQVLDISEPVSQVAEFYEPGMSAVWNAWLELMADPY